MKMDGSEAKVILARRERIMYTEYTIVRVFIEEHLGVALFLICWKLLVDKPRFELAYVGYRKEYRGFKDCALSHKLCKIGVYYGK